MSDEIPLGKERDELPQSKELLKAEEFLADAQLLVQKGEYASGIDKFICALRIVQKDGDLWVYMGQHLVSLWVEVVNHSKIYKPEVHEMLDDHTSSFFDTVALLEAPISTPTKIKPGRVGTNIVMTGNDVHFDTKVEGVLNPLAEVYERLGVMREILTTQ